MLSGVLIVVFMFVLCGCVSGKECTNIPTQLSSHSFRYELLASKNESWKAEMFQHYHLIHTDDSAWSSLRPRKVLREREEEVIEEPKKKTVIEKKKKRERILEEEKHKGGIF